MFDLFLSVHDQLGHKEAFATHLRQEMQDELKRRNYSQALAGFY